MGYESRLNPNADAAAIGGVIDARGRRLEEGDEIILSVQGPIYFRVAGITPMLDPAAPPGMMHVHVGVMATFIAKRGQINREFIRVRTAEEAGPMQFKLLEAIQKEQEGGHGPGPDGN